MRSGEFGTRWSSRISIVTFHPLSSPSPLRSTPSTASGWRPVSSASCWRAFLTTSIGFVGLLAMLCPPLLTEPSLLESREEDVDALLELLVVDLAGLMGHLHGHELAHDVLLVEELVLGLLEQLLGDPAHAADGRERQGEQRGEEAHRYCAPTNECGGSGPSSLNCMRCARLRLTRSTAASNSSMRSCSTRNPALTTMRSCSGASGATATASGSSSLRMSRASRARISSTAWATSSPRRIRSKWVAASGLPWMASRARAISGCSTSTSRSTTSSRYSALTLIS